MTPPILEFDEDIGQIKISGESIELELTNFWKPLQNRIEEYLRNPRDIHLIVALEFFNSLTARKLLNMLRYIEGRCNETDRHFTVTWIYDDAELKGAGEHYASIIKNATVWRFREEKLD